MTMERDSLVARLEKRAKFNEATIKIDKVAFYERSDIALDREAAAALSRPEQVVPPTTERPTSDAWKPSSFAIRNELARREDAGKDARVPLTAPPWAEHLTSEQLRAMLASAPASPAIGVQVVKALEWVDNEASSPVGHYRVQRLDSKWEPLRDGYYMLPRLHGIVKAFDTPEDARAHCQADYEQRILSALHPAPEAASAGAAPTNLQQLLEAYDFNGQEWAPKAAAPLQADASAPASPAIERAAPAQEPVAWQWRVNYRDDWSATKSEFSSSDLSRGMESDVHPLYDHPSSEPELRAEIVRLTRERDELRACEASWEQTRLAIAHMRNENGGLRSRVEALSAEVGTARAAAFEEAAQIADGHARNAWEIAVGKGEDDICASGRHYAARDIEAAIRSRAFKGATE